VCDTQVLPLFWFYPPERVDVSHPAATPPALLAAKLFRWNSVAENPMLKSTVKIVRSKVVLTVSSRYIGVKRNQVRGISMVRATAL
jgi:hypothetical protein